MNVLLQTRARRSVERTPGGDVTQAEATARALTAFDVSATVSPALSPDLSSVDLVHVFNIGRPQDAVVQARNAWRQGRPVALSTVYCDFSSFERHGRRGAVGKVGRHLNSDTTELFKAVARAIYSRELHRGIPLLATPGYSRLQAELLAGAQLVLPNSHSEFRRLQRDMRLTSSLQDRTEIVPNGIDPVFYSVTACCGPPPSEFRAHAGCVLCVGRIEGRKNQLNLIRALSGTDLRLVLAGKFAANQPRYARAVLREARRAGNVSILGPVTEPEKRWLYHLAATHVLPSWMETTGLSSLEAAVMDCGIVVTPYGDTREYFGSDVEYCEPGDPMTIREAIRRALVSGRSDRLKSRILKNYTWEEAARVTACAYRKVVSQ